MDLVIEQELDSLPTTIEEITRLVNQYLKQENFIEAIKCIDKALTIFPHSLYHLHYLRYALYKLPAQLEYYKYYLLLLNYKVFDHKILEDKIFKVVFELDKSTLPRNSPLLHAFLSNCVITRLDIEILLCNERHTNLQLLLAKNLDQINLPLLKALVYQCYLNEYVWSQDQFSVQQIISLLKNANQVLSSTHTLDYYHKCVILLSTCYFSLTEIISFYPVIGSACQVDADLLTLYNLQVTSSQEEEQLRNTIHKVTAIDPTISAQVQSQYEDYPYPRWLSVEIQTNIDFRNFLNAISQKASSELNHLNALNLDNPQILIAGSGTGSQPLMISNIENSEILAIDLSLSSLAYAKRQSQLLQIKNISYAQGDLTKAEQLGRKFDYIESVGVLHHTRNIENSLRKLCEVLKPHGIMRLGLYSSTARAELKFIKQFVKENHYTADLHGVRQLRQDIKARTHLKEFDWAVGFADFYTTNMCIDLLFHTHELTTSIPEIKKLLRKNNLKFIGFDFPYYMQISDQYRQMFPEDTLMNNLTNWHKFEQLHPRTFRSMYCFIVQKMN